MGFKKYIIASVIFMLIISISTHFLELGVYELIVNAKIEGLFDLELLKHTLPIYIWIVIPTFILFILTLAHMMFYGSKSYFHSNALSSDIQTIQEHIESRLLNETSNKKLKTSELKELGSILDQLEINTTNEEFNSQNTSLNFVVEQVSKITNNEYVNNKSIKLDKDNILSKQNLINKINKEENFALELLKSADDYEDNIVYMAFNKAIDNKPLEKVKVIIENLSLTNEMVTILLLKDSTQEAEGRFTNSEILNLIKDKQLSNKELINIAKNYKKTMQPEQLIKLFEDISAADENLTESYLYVLFEYQMMPQINEVLINSQREEFTVFKALMDLKDAGKHYTLENLTLSS